MHPYISFRLTVNWTVFRIFINLLLLTHTGAPPLNPAGGRAPRLLPELPRRRGDKVFLKVNVWYSLIGPVRYKLDWCGLLLIQIF